MSFGKTIFQRRMEQQAMDADRQRQQTVEDRNYELRVNQLALQQMNAAKESERHDFWKQLEMSRMMGKASFVEPGYQPKAQTPALQEGVDVGRMLAEYEMEKAGQANSWRVPWQEAIARRDGLNRASRDHNANVTHLDRVMNERGRNDRQEDQQVFLGGQGDLNRKNRLDVAATMASSWIPPQTRVALDLSKQLRSEQTYKDTQTVAAAASKIIKARDTGQDDLVLITAFMKMIDPTTGVRDQEFQNAMRASGLVEQANVWFPRIAEGDMLSPETRRRFKEATKQALASQKTRYDAVYENFAQTADRYGVDRRDLMGELNLAPELLLGSDSADQGSEFEE